MEKIKLNCRCYAKNNFAIVCIGIGIILLRTAISNGEGTAEECKTEWEFTCSPVAVEGDCIIIAAQLKSQALDSLYDTMEAFQELNCSYREKNADNVTLTCLISPEEGAEDNSIYCGKSEFSVGFRSGRQSRIVGRIRGFVKGYIRDGSHLSNMIESHKEEGQAYGFDDRMYLENVSGEVDPEGHNEVILKHCAVVAKTETMELCEPVAPSGTDSPDSSPSLHSVFTAVAVMTVCGLLLAVLV